MNSRLKNALVTSILIAVLFPMIPTAVVGITWLATFGGFDFMVVVRTTTNDTTEWDYGLHQYNRWNS
jgi:hypothetical protein